MLVPFRGKPNFVIGRFLIDLTLHYEFKKNRYINLEIVDANYLYN